jgi:hypothetical protein
MRGIQSSGMLHHVALTDVSEEHISSIVRAKFSELGMLAVTSNRSTLRRNTMCTILFLHSVFQLQVLGNVVPSSTILLALMMQEIRSSEKSVLTEPHGITSHNTAFFARYLFTTGFVCVMPSVNAHLPNCTGVCVRFEVFTAVTMKDGLFSYVTPCDSCKNRRF